VENSCFLIDALFKAMENRLLLHSELALQLWVHVKFIVEEAPGKILFHVLLQIADYNIHFA